ncbi:MAG TPA: SDR family NAD(P)-dependent oxidoreductase, partial [Burkholderiaceae bacterium]
MDKRVVFITGASKGIGAAVAVLAAQRGYAVAINYRDDAQAATRVQRQIEATGGTACVVQGDVADADQVERMFTQAEAALGPLHALINSAGITGPIGQFAEADPAMIEQVFRTNVYGAMHCCRTALRRFRASGTRGVIVNVSSVAAATGSPNEYVHYAASKGAIDSFT